MWVHDVLCCCVRCADDIGTARKECQRCVLLSQSILMVPTTSVPGTSTAQFHERIPYLCTWHLVSLVDAIVCGRTTRCVAAYDVLTDTGDA